MPTGTISQNATVGGVSIQSQVTRTEEGQIGQEVSLPAAKTGTLSTRTSDTAGTLTLEASHGVIETDVFNIFWTDADGVRKCAYGATAGVIDGNDVPFTGASGDVLPAQDFTITASEVVVIDIDFDGDLLEMIAVGAPRLAHVAFRDSGPAVLKAITLPAGEGWSWASDQGIASPLAGNPVNDVRASNGDATAATTLTIGLLYNSA